MLPLRLLGRGIMTISIKKLPLVYFYKVRQSNKTITIGQAFTFKEALKEALGHSLWSVNWENAMGNGVDKEIGDKK